MRTRDELGDRWRDTETRQSVSRRTASRATGRREPTGRTLARERQRRRRGDEKHPSDDRCVSVRASRRPGEASIITAMVLAAQASVGRLWSGRSVCCSHLSKWPVAGPRVRADEDGATPRQTTPRPVGARVRSAGEQPRTKHAVSRLGTRRPFRGPIAPWSQGATRGPRGAAECSRQEALSRPPSPVAANRPLRRTQLTGRRERQRSFGGGVGGVG